MLASRDSHDGPSGDPAADPPGRFYLGCAVWGHQGWVGSFYPAGTRPPAYLRTYAERLTAVEGNTTFYRVPEPSVVDRWAADLPAGFHLCPKLNRELTHGSDLAAAVPGAAAFLATVTRLGDRLGPVLVQLPGRFSPDQLPELQTFLEAWPSERAMGLELRHPAWFRRPHGNRMLELLERLGHGRAILDSRPVYSGSDDPQVQSERAKPRLPVLTATTGRVALVRFISHPERARNVAYLEEWAERVDAWLRRGIAVYFFVHCPQELLSPFIAREFQALLEARGAPVPPLPWSRVESAPLQRGLFD